MKDVEITSFSGKDMRKYLEKHVPSDRIFSYATTLTMMCAIISLELMKYLPKDSDVEDDFLHCMAAYNELIRNFCNDEPTELSTLNYH